MFSKPRLTLLLAALLGLTTLTACGPSTSDSSGEVVLRVGDQTGATQSRLKAAGLLGNLPYKIEWSQFAAAVDLHEALRADAIDIGGANDSPTVTAIAGGSKIKVAAAWSNGGKGTYILVPKDSPIRTVTGLKGKTGLPDHPRQRRALPRDRRTEAGRALRQGRHAELPRPLRGERRVRDRQHRRLGHLERLRGACPRRTRRTGAQ
jgi:hypothetical protein